MQQDTLVCSFSFTGIISPTPCDAGVYCPPGSYLTTYACPVGTFASVGGLFNESQCTACTAGSYCPVARATSVAGICTAGFWCPPGSTTAQGGDSVNGVVSRICGAGYFCPAGSPSPIACPSGTYQPALQQSASTACLPCTPGNYCNGTGLGVVSGQCFGGYYCSLNVSTPTPIDTATIIAGTSTGGDICPRGAWCPAGSSSPRWCSPGSYKCVVRIC